MVYCRHVWKSEIVAPEMPFCESKMVFPWNTFNDVV